MRIGFYLWRITSAKGKSLFSLTQPILPPDDEMGRFGGVVGCGVRMRSRFGLDVGELPTFGGIRKLGVSFCYFWGLWEACLRG